MTPDKKRLDLNTGLSFLLNDVESKTDSEERDKILQAQIIKLNSKIERIKEVVKDIGIHND